MKLKVLPLVIILVLSSLIWIEFDVIRVVGPSMQPTYAPGERVLGCRFLLWFNNIKPGDIITFPHPQSGEILIKRVVKVDKSLVWVEGDNKNNSEDSREFGPIRFDTIQTKIWN